MANTSTDLSEITMIDDIKDAKCSHKFETWKFERGPDTTKRAWICSASYSYS
jgi:hypothetical protein